MFDEAMNFLRVRPKQLLLIATLVIVPSKAIAAAVPGSSLRRARPEQIIDLIIDNVVGVDSALANVVSYGLESIGLFFLGVMYGELAAAWFVGQAPSTKEILLSTFRRSHKLLAVWFAAKALLLVGGVLSMGVASLLVGVILSILAPLLGAERMSMRAAMLRSSELVSSKLGLTGFVYIITGVGAVLMRLAIKESPSLILSQFVGGSRPPDWLIFGISDVVGSVVAAAFVASAAVVLYLDLRVRREGIDLDLAIRTTFPRNKARQVSSGRG